MKKSVSGIIVLLFVTIIPVVTFFYFKGKNNFDNSASPKKMWPVGLSENGKDSAYFQLPVFNAINANGDEISTEMMNGNISVIECFFSNCQSICPIMNKQMSRVFDNLSQNKNFKIFSYTVDPDRDSLNVLNAYALNHNADLNQWYFLRTEQDSIFNFGRWSLKLPLDNAEEMGNFLHSERFVLVDWDRNIRGYYDGTDSNSVNKMMNHIVLLLSEKNKLDKKLKNE